MRGRKPKTGAQALADGDTRKLGRKKLLEQVESRPKATRGLPTASKHLQGEALRSWKFWVEELDAMGLSRRPDAMALEGACFNYAGAIQAEEIISREGPTVTESTVNDDGDVVILKVKAHPAVGIARQRWTLVKAFCSEFGLTPVSRERLTIEKRDDGEADLMALLSRPRERRPVVN